MIENKYTFKPRYTYKDQLEQDLKDKFMNTKIMPEKVYVERPVYAAMFGNSPSGRFAFKFAEPVFVNFIDSALYARGQDNSCRTYAVEILSEGA